jgi:Na+(H+)/acetate symporter ActP
MQFIILFIGAMVFVFYQFTTPPLFFNPVEVDKVKNSEYKNEYIELESEYEYIYKEKRHDLNKLVTSIEHNNEKLTSKISTEVLIKEEKADLIKNNAIEIIKKVNPDADTNDTNYIFLSFIINFLPVGIIGLLIAAILSASMSSTSAELNALASTSIIDFYKRLFKKNASERHYLKASKLATVFWGFYAILFALFAQHLGSLIEAVNILGSLVYGTILGIFLTAFYLKKIGGTPTFIAAIVAECAVLYCYFFTNIPFLWYNVIGCLIVIVLSVFISIFTLKKAAR